MKEFKVTDSILPDEQVFNRIVIIRGQRVIIDSDLAELYCIEVKVLKQARWTIMNKWLKSIESLRN